MKKIIFYILFSFLLNLQSFGQAKKPTLMVVPADVWCKENGYWQTFDNQGTKVGIPNYKEAFQSNQDLLLVIGKINTLFADRGFPLKNLESVIKDLEQQSAEDAMTASKTSGAALAESPLDKLLKRAKADIIIQVTWKVNQTGPKKSITFNMQGLDSYSNKQIAEKIKEVGGEFKINFGPRRAGDAASLYADNQKIRTDFNWSPKYGLKKIIESAYLWHKNHPNGYEDR